MRDLKFKICDLILIGYLNGVEAAECTRQIYKFTSYLQVAWHQIPAQLPGIRD